MAAIANQFCALEYNVTERRVDDGTSFENEVNEAVKAALSSLDAGTQPGTKSTKKDAKATANEGGDNGGTDHPVDSGATASACEVGHGSCDNRSSLCLEADRV